MVVNTKSLKETKKQTEAIEIIVCVWQEPEGLSCWKPADLVAAESFCVLETGWALGATSE